MINVQHQVPRLVYPHIPNLHYSVGPEYSSVPHCAAAAANVRVPDLSSPPLSTSDTTISDPSPVVLSVQV